MREESIGERLRQARVAKGYDLEDVAQLSEVPTHYLLAMEMDQFKLLPQEKINSYIESYAESVGLDGVSLIHGYRNVKLSKEKAKVALTSVSPAENQVVGENTISTVAEASANKESQPVSLKTRRSRHPEENQRRAYLPLIVLTLMSLAILLFVAYITWQQLQASKNQSSSPEYSLASTSQGETGEENSSSTASSEPQAQPSLTSSGADDRLDVTLANASPQVPVLVSLKDGSGEAWLAVSDTDIAETGVLLTADNPSYKTTLSAETSSALITLGSTQNVSVTVDGQPLDLSPLTSSLTYLTLTIQR